MLNLIPKKYLMILGACILLAVAYGGYWFGKGNPTIVTEVVEKEKIVFKEAKKTAKKTKKITKTETKADGSKVVTVVESAEDSVETSKAGVKDNSTETKPTVHYSPKKDFRVGAGANIGKYDDLLPGGQPKDYEVSGGMRILGSDFWLETKYTIKKQEVTIGISKEF